MTEEIINLMPKEEIEILLKSIDTYEIISTYSKDDIKKVLISTEMITTGEWKHVFCNKKDTPIVIKIFRN